MTKPKDYTSQGWKAGLVLIAVLVGVSFIPPLEVWGLHLRRANILSEVISFEDPKAEEELLVEAAVEEISIDWSAISEAVETAPGPDRAVERTLSWHTSDLSPADTLLTEQPLAPLVLTEPKQPAVRIEDYDTTGQSPLKAFYAKIASRRPVRIAFLGDSFVEGDILTADLREELQQHFGGKGVGFAPMASPLTGFRRTVKTQAKGWTSYNVMQQAKAPEEVQPLFTMAGWVCRPESGASTRWEGSDARACLTPCDGANLWFLCRQDARIEVEVNDSLRRVFDWVGDEALRRLEVIHPGLRSLTLKILSGEEGFVGYGAQFLGEEGVTLDNFSIRSNNGRALFKTSPALNAQWHDQQPYDLVVLQYGLNMMQQGVLGYTKYGEQIEQMIHYVRQCFPQAAILVLGVSERWVKGEKGFEPMDAIPAMVACQRGAATATGAAFWPTSDAMTALGGMEHFVQQGWAGKDYTHINYGGGRQIAHALFEALYAEIYPIWQEQHRVVEREMQPILNREQTDSLLRTSALKLIP